MWPLISFNAYMWPLISFIAYMWPLISFNTEAVRAKQQATKSWGNGTFQLRTNECQFLLMTAPHTKKHYHPPLQQNRDSYCPFTHDSYTYPTARAITISWSFITDQARMHLSAKTKKTKKKRTSVVPPLDWPKKRERHSRTALANGTRKQRKEIKRPSRGWITCIPFLGACTIPWYMEAFSARNHLKIPRTTTRLERRARIFANVKKRVNIHVTLSYTAEFDRWKYSKTRTSNL